MNKAASLQNVFLSISILLLGTASPQAADSTKAEPSGLAVRGLHLSAPAKKDLPLALGFIRTNLPEAGVNVLILEFDYNFNFQSRPEFAQPSALGKDEVKEILKACREQGIELIPQINCLGHQSWAARNDRLLQKHPEFDETPGKYPGNKDIYCRSYCPLHPEVHKVLFELIDELAGACEAKSFHVGMDEVFILADPDCPRCKGKTTASVFAGEIQTLRDHFKQIGCRMWMWGDRLIDGKAARVGKWEGSENGTQTAIDLVPKDIVICDWHYDSAPETAKLFVEKGFDVVSCPWRKPEVALKQLAQICSLRKMDDPVGRRALGMVQTTWCGFTPFAKAAKDDPAYWSENHIPAKNAVAESANCFQKLFKAIREKP